MKMRGLLLYVSSKLANSRLLKKKINRLQPKLGFTIVELLVVIMVIGVLAGITIVSYTGISQRATAAAMQSDLSNASKQLKLFQVTNSAYPLTIDCGQPDSSTNKCIKASNANSFSYNGSTNAFNLVETNSANSIYYRVTNDSAPTISSSLNYGLVGYWPLDEGSGTSVGDFSGNMNSGTWGGTLGSQWAVGRIGNWAGSFNGTNNYYGTNSISYISPATPFTVSFWLKLNVINATHEFFSNKINTSTQFVIGVRNTSNLIEGSFYNGSSYSLGFRTMTVLSAATWYHFAYVYNGSSRFIYLNGSIDDNGNSNLGGALGTDGTLTIGQRNDRANIAVVNGAIDDVRVYNRVLTATEVTALYNGSL